LPPEQLSADILKKEQRIAKIIENIQSILVKETHDHAAFGRPL
jgi:hypothetical protein